MTRHYSSTAVTTSLTAGCTDSATSIQVDDTTGFPAVDFVLALDYGAAEQELVLVTGVAGTTLTVTRGFDSTTAVAHLLGAEVRHVHAAADFRDSRTHEDATTGVHGVSGALVGTTSTQALTNKDLTTGNTFPSTLATDAEVATAQAAAQAAAEATAAAALSAHEADTSTHGVATVAGISETQTLTNKTLSLGSNTVTGTRAQFNTALSDDDFATLAGTETLTNKTLTSPTVTGLTLDSVNVSAAWDSYTPVWTATGGGVSGYSATGYYKQVGKTVVFWAKVTADASGFNNGSSQYRISLPVAAASHGTQLVQAEAYDNSGDSLFASKGRIAAGATIAYLWCPPTTAGVSDRAMSNAAPFTFAASDVITIQGTYEAA